MIQFETKNLVENESCNWRIWFQEKLAKIDKAHKNVE